MPVKNISFLAALLLSEQNHLCNFGKRHYEEHSREIILNLDQRFISYLELWQPFCSVERNHLCNFVVGHYEEHFCDITLNWD